LGVAIATGDSATGLGEILGETLGETVGLGSPIATGFVLSRGSGANDRSRVPAQGLLAQAGRVRVTAKRKSNLGDTSRKEIKEYRQIDAHL
jgi:hypothetical protein